jgi:hypothetical protein
VFPCYGMDLPTAYALKEQLRALTEALESATPPAG